MKRKLILQMNCGKTEKWYVCPNCNKKLIKYDKDAYSKSIFLICKNCKSEIEIKISNK